MDGMAGLDGLSYVSMVHVAAAEAVLQSAEEERRREEEVQGESAKEAAKATTRSEAVAAAFHRGFRSQLEVEGEARKADELEAMDRALEDAMRFLRSKRQAERRETR